MPYGRFGSISSYESEPAAHTYDVTGSLCENNVKMRSAELLLQEDKNVKLIRRAETLDDYFSTLDGIADN